MVNTRLVLVYKVLVYYSINKKKIERNNEMQMKSNCAKDFNFYLKQNILYMPRYAISRIELDHN
jgi:hypothetical protein